MCCTSLSWLPSSCLTTGAQVKLLASINLTITAPCLVLSQSLKLCVITKRKQNKTQQNFLHCISLPHCQTLQKQNCGPTDADDKIPRIFCWVRISYTLLVLPSTKKKNICSSVQLKINCEFEKKANKIHNLNFHPESISPSLPSKLEQFSYKMYSV